MSSVNDSTRKSKSEKTLSHPPIIVDLGLKTRTKINKLKKGEGPLFDAACQTVETLQSEGHVGKDVQVVMVVVQEIPDGIVLPHLPWSRYTNEN